MPPTTPTPTRTTRTTTRTTTTADPASESASALSAPSECSSSLVLTAKYLEHHRNKKDLVTRLRNVMQTLQQDENIEADSSDYPGLAALCQSLVQFVNHRDKQVRLYTVAACMELFGIYAPDAPWSTLETLDIFRQTIRQLANLAHTTSSSQANFSQYWRILELLAHVKIGVLLVDLTKEDDDNAQEALQVLCELFRTVLQSVRLEHPPEIAELAQGTIGGCLEEYYEGVMLPIPLLDEVLVCIGQGPTVLVVNPLKASEQKRSKKALPPHQVEQANPSYLVASSVVRKTVDRLSTPIAALLNGLLNNDARTVSESSILTQPTSETLAKPQPQNQLSQADVWSIVYELHKIAPSILTTVIGTLTNYLSVPEVHQRQLVVRLLGRLFVKSPKLALQFRPCFREWTRRSKDVQQDIRITMVEYLLLLITCDNNEISEEVQPVLAKCLEDPSPDVRLACIHGLCDTAYKHRTAISLDLWRAVSARVTSKHRQERKDAVTGLAQTYYKNVVSRDLQKVNAGGDDCPIETVLEAARSDHTQDGGDRYSSIPTRVFECVGVRDDEDLQSRLTQIVDDLLLGSELPHSTKKLTSTARAVGLASLLDRLQPNAYSWMGQFLQQRSKLQQTLSLYLDARSETQKLDAGSEAAFTADAKAHELLEKVAALTGITTEPGERNPTLVKFHKAKDRHVFRILSTIVNPAHTSKARIRALEELPKRVKSLGDAVSTWVKVLVRRCSMGDFLNCDVVHHSVLLAQECFHQQDVEACGMFLRCVQAAADPFPSLAAHKESFETLMELFVDCRTSSKKKEMSGLVTALGYALAKAAPHNNDAILDDNMRKQLMNICCKDGTPEQARNAVSTISAFSLTTETETGTVFVSLLKALASPSRLNLSVNLSPALVTVLVSLAELSEAAPDIMSLPAGKRAVQFALDKVLLGREDPSGDHDDNPDVDEANSPTAAVTSPRKRGIVVGTPASATNNRRRKSSFSKSYLPDGQKNLKNLSPGVQELVLQDNSLSVTCRIICAAIDFVTSYIRFSAMAANPQLATERDATEGQRQAVPYAKSCLPPSQETVGKVFEILSQILRDHGMPPSNHQRKACKSRQDLAALRSTASINLLRLCDPHLPTNQNFLTPARWHILSSSFLDDERAVRDSVMGELGLMLTGHGKYGKNRYWGKAMAPQLRFLALVTLCTDGDGGASHYSVNGNAAHVGKRSISTKANASECVASLRQACDVTSAQARADGPEAEKQFEGEMKMMLMPEYAVPFAFHLLSHRRETPTSGVSANARTTRSTRAAQDSEETEADEGRHRILRKRLKWLFDPLVLSLGDSADNISFLLRMTELMDKKFTPRGHGLTLTTYGGHRNVATCDTDLLQAKLKVICAASRQILLSYVKKDVNLASFPGVIQLPASLFQRRPEKRAQPSPPKKYSRPAPAAAIEPKSRASKARASHRHDAADNHNEAASVAETDDATIPIQADSPSARSRQSASASGASMGRRSTIESSQGDASGSQADSKHDGTASVARRSPRLRDPRTDSSVHFSPEFASQAGSQNDISTSFDGLSPIGNQASPEACKSILLSSGEKTSRTTTPSFVQPTKFSSSMSVGTEDTNNNGGSVANDAATVSESTRSKPGKGVTMEYGRVRRRSTTTEAPGESESRNKASASPTKKRRRGFLVKGNPTVKKIRKRSVPAQIKIVRHKPTVQFAPKRNLRRTGGRLERNYGEMGDSLDFEEPQPKKTKRGTGKIASRGKENQTSTRDKRTLRKVKK